jgi:predicted phage gp36 major capsid-like protein
MTTDPDLTPETVERMAHAAEAVAGLLTLTPDQSEACMDAVDAIRSLAAENARLRAEMESGSFYQEKDIDAMQAELARLRATRADELARAYMLGVGDAAEPVDCGCDLAQKALAAAAEKPNGGPRWMACGEENCGAIEADAIRALTPPADLADRVKGGE